MALPASGYATGIITAPDGDIDDYVGIVDLAIVCSDSSDFSSGWNTDSNGYGRVAMDSGPTELASDWIDLDNGSETGIVRFYVSTVLAAATEAARTVRLYPPNTSNSQYSAGDTYGSDNAYDSDWWGYWPLGGGDDRTSNSRDMTGVGSPTIGGVAGKIGNGTDYSGSQYSFVNEVVSSYPVMLLTWAEPDDVTGNYVTLCVGGSSDTLFLWQPENDLRARIYSDFDEISNGLSQNTFYHHTGRITSGEVECYQDGTGSGSPTSHSNSFPSETSTVIGAFYFSSSFLLEYDGILQECQVHTEERSDNWITQEYNQTNDNDTFWGAWSWQAVVDESNAPFFGCNF
jgi:hypothetical protein